jgi:hypothetical protein
VVADKLAALDPRERLQGLQELFEADRLEDPLVLADVDRLLYFNDALSPQIRRQARVWAVKVLEKHGGKDPYGFGVDGIFVNMRESAYGGLETYGAHVLGSMYEKLSPEQQRRTRGLLYQGLLGTANGRQGLISTQLLSHLAEPEDKRFLWALLEPSSYESTQGPASGEAAIASSEVEQRAYQVLGAIIAKEQGVDALENLPKRLERIGLSVQRSLTEKGQGRKPPEYGQQVRERDLMRQMALNLPELARSQRGLSERDRERLVGTLLDMAARWQKKSDSTPIGDLPLAYHAVGDLLLTLPHERRKPYLNQLLSQVTETPLDKLSKDLLTNLFYVLYDGEINRKSLQDFYLNAKLDTISQPVKQEWKIALQERARQVLSSGGDRMEQILLQEPDLIFRDPRSIRPKAQESPLLRSNRFLTPIPFSPTTEALFNLNLNVSADGLPPKLQRTWHPAAMEPFAQPAATHPKAEIQRSLTQALQAEAPEPLQQAVDDAMRSWLVDGSEAAYKSLQSVAGRPLVFDTLLTHLYELRHTSARQGWRKQVPDNVPAKQMLALLKTAASEHPFNAEEWPAETQNLLRFHLQEGRLWPALQASKLQSLLLGSLDKTHPELRLNMAETALTLYESMSTNATLTEARQATVGLIFNLLKGEPLLPEALKPHQVGIRQLLREIPLLQNNFQEQNQLCLWETITHNSEESSSELSLVQRRNFDQWIRLAALADDSESLQAGIQWLNTQYERSRNQAYIDETFFIHVLRQPEVIQAGVRTENPRVRDAFINMATGLRVFEAVPEMVRQAARTTTPVDTASYLKASISTMGHYAQPYLDQMLTDPTVNGSEKAVIRQLKGQMRFRGPVYELFNQYPIAEQLPEFLEPRSTPGNVSTMTDRPSDSQPKPSPVTFIGLQQQPPADAVAPTRNDGESVSPPSRPARASNWTRPVTFPGLLDSAPVANGNYLAAIREAVARFDTQSSPGSRQQEVDRALLYAQTFSESVQRRGTRVALDSPERRELTRQLAERLENTRDNQEKRLCLGVLSAIANPSILPTLSRFINGEPESELRLQAIRLVGDLGQSSAIAPMRERMTRLFSPPSNIPEAVATLNTLIRLGDSESVEAILLRPNLPEALRTEAVAGIGQLLLETDTARSALDTALRESRPGSELRLAAIQSFGAILMPDDADAINRLVQSAENEPIETVAAAVSSLEGCELTQAAQNWLRRVRVRYPSLARKVNEVLNSA